MLRKSLAVAAFTAAACAAVPVPTAVADGTVVHCPTGSFREDEWHLVVSQCLFDGRRIDYPNEAHLTDVEIAIDRQLPESGFGGTTKNSRVRCATLDGSSVVANGRGCVYVTVGTPVNWWES